eukprot:CAMPEP_0181474334 /NCGR_PEP_ID=MMETSP1110-20121109/40596_1 /TAXON_ID=174948 /ORGANISM="Symbiodinium sp., Strain CCMP421" /LENGTH=60 /DNA_ID=CAMNT_0023599499 /DNA_START=891 /DNA_END=1073 /DNA_ORIENTATION=+
MVILDKGRHRRHAEASLLLAVEDLHLEFAVSPPSLPVQRVPGLRPAMEKAAVEARPPSLV